MTASPPNRPIAVDLFAGAGGLSLGLEQAGYDVAAAVEYDPIHAAVHEYNFPSAKVFCMDAAQISGAEIRAFSSIQQSEIHLVAGGPPCQGISMMGKRALDDPRNALLGEYARLVIELQPRYFVMENVAGLTLGNHRQLLDEVVEMLSAGGFKVLLPYRILQAADFGAPQSRKRLILMGARADVAMPSYPEATHKSRRINGRTTLVASGLPLGPSVWDAIGDIPDADTFDDLLVTDSAVASFLEPSTYAASLRNLSRESDDFGYARTFDRNRLTSSMRTIHTATSRARFAATKVGTTETVSRFLRLHPDGISNTLRAGTASDRGAHTAPRPIHPTYPRVITVREAARLHGYPDWYRFHVTKWNGFRQIGNSVPARLGRAVGSAILASDGLFVSAGGTADLGDPRLLHFTAAEAGTYFGLTRRVIPQREKRSAVLVP